MNFIAYNKFIFEPYFWLLSFYAKINLWLIYHDFITAINI
jgi:hypothetical protein